MKKIFILSLLLAGSLIFGGCSLYGGTQNSSANPTTSNTTETSKTGSTTIDIQNFSFNPGTLTVKTGSTVTWTNRDSVNHQIKSDTFNSAPLGTNQTYSFTFTTAGTYNYSCAIHPSMTGTVIVQ